MGKALGRFFFALALLCVFEAASYADCQGCCSGHGGVVCAGGITRCEDGTALSSTCVAKGCNACSSATSTATSTSTSSTTTLRPASSTQLSTTTTSVTTTSSTSPTTTTSSTIPSIFVSTQLIFPHVADGGGYKTSLLLTNRSSISTTARVSFLTEQGTGLAVNVGGTTASDFTVTVSALGSAKLETTGDSPIASAGWARVLASPPAEINGNSVFQLFSRGALFSEASVPAVLPTSSADFYADEEGGFNTGVAITNPGTRVATGTLWLRNKQGIEVGLAPINLDPGHHRALFLSEIFPGAPSGRVEIILTSGYVAVTALRSHTSSVFSAVAVGQSPITAMFSPAGGIRARIISEIDKAQATIDIAIYSFTADTIRDALVRARNRSVAIRIIADTSQANGQGTEIGTLEQMGFSLKRMSGLSGGIMHNKYMIIDDQTLFTGSYNWSANAEDNSFENAVFIQGSSVITNYVADFNRMWGR